jgi:hypothetical protein
MHARGLIGGFFAERWMAMRRYRPSFCGLVFTALIFSTARADMAADIARIHMEAIGGKERIAALAAVRATGGVITNGKVVRFTMVAARPARARLETEANGRTLVQATDGVEEPWEFDTGAWPPVYRAMPAASAKIFAADSEFDDPLVTGSSRGFVIEYAGEMEVDGRKLLRLLVTRKLIETFSLLVDPETYFILKRVEKRTTVSGRSLHVITHYEDFRPVDGVLMAHKIVQSVDGRVTQETQITKIEANPKVNEETFRRPKVAVPGLQKS